MYLIDGFRRVTLSSVTRVDFSLYRRTRGVIRIDSLGQSTNISPKMTWSLSKSDYSSLCCISLNRQLLFGTGNQGNNQNFDLSLLSNKCWLIFIGMKQIFFLKKKSKWPIKKTEIFNSLNIFSQKFIWAKLIFIDPSDIL